MSAKARKRESKLKALPAKLHYVASATFATGTLALQSLKIFTAASNAKKFREFTNTELFSLLRRQEFVEKAREAHTKSRPERQNFFAVTPSPRLRG